MKILHGIFLVALLLTIVGCKKSSNNIGSYSCTCTYGRQGWPDTMSIYHYTGISRDSAYNVCQGDTALVLALPGVHGHGPCTLE